MRKRKRKDKGGKRVKERKNSVEHGERRREEKGETWEEKYDEDREAMY